MDLSPRGVYATLLDEGVYLGSVSTFYRLADLTSLHPSPRRPTCGAALQAWATRKRTRYYAYPRWFGSPLVHITQSPTPATSGPRQGRRFGLPGSPWLSPPVQFRRVIDSVSQWSILLVKYEGGDWNGLLRHACS